MLIEAAHALPAWVSPDNAENRVCHHARNRTRKESDNSYGFEQAI